MINDLTLKLIIQAVDLATKDIDGVHEKLQALGDELTKNEFSRSAEGMQAFSDSVKGATQPLADAAKNTLALSAAITGMASYMAGQAYQSAVSYESALADLAKVIDGGMDSAKGYGQQLNQMALQYSQNGQELVQAMANFVQAGYEADEAFRLVEQSVKLMIAGELEAGDASRQLVSILKGFKEPADQAGRAVDILNEVSNKYATNVKELATGMAAISPIAKQMGFSMEETAGLLTPVIEVFQSGSEAADALKTGLQRLTDNSAPVKDALASIGVSQLDLNGNMRSGKEVFLDVARSMVGLTDAQKSFVVQQLVGVDQAGRMTKVFDNLAVYLGVTNTALDSTGSALKEVNARLETSEASNRRAAESWRQLGVTLGNTLKPQITGVIDATGNLAKAFDGAVKSGDLAPLLNVIKPQVAAVENLFQAMAANMQGALAGVDWTPLVNGIKELSGEFGEAFAALTDGMDLMTQSGLQTFLQNLINLLGNFTQYVAGIVDGLEPFIDGLNVLFKAVSTNLPGFSKLIGQIQGLSLSINQGLPFILEWGNRIFGVVGAIVDWTVKIGLLIGAFKLLTAAGIPVGAMLTGLVTQFLALNPAMAGVLAGLAGLPGLVLALVAAAGGLGVALGTLVNKTVEWATGGESIGSMLYDWANAGEAARLGLNGLTDAQNQATAALKDARVEYATGRITLAEYNAALEKYKTAFGGLNEDQVKAREALAALNAEYQTGKATLEELVAAQAEYLALFGPTNDAQLQAKAALEAVVAAQKDGKATLVDVVVEQKKYLDLIHQQVAAELARVEPIRKTIDGIKERTQAEKEAAEAAERQAKANQAKIDLDNQQSATNEKLKASFAALGLIYDANTGQILRQNELTAAQKQAQLELGIALDKVGVSAGVMSGRITAAGTEMLATFNAIALNSQATSEQITAAFLTMIPRAATNAELEAIRVKIEELARQGKISGDEAAAGLAAIGLQADNLADSSAFSLIAKNIQDIAQASIDAVRGEEQLIIALQDAAKSSYELAKAKGNEYEARQQLTLIAQTEARQAQLNAEAKLIELQSANAIVAALQREIQERQAAGEAIDEATIKRLKSATIAQETSAIESAAAGRVAEAERQLAEIAARAAGPIGELIRLYQDQADALDRTRSAIESTYDARQAEQQSIERIAIAQGDERAAREAVIEQKNLAADQARELAVLAQEEADLALQNISIKTLELAADGELSAADQQQIADLQLLALEKQNAADSARLNADALDAEAGAVRRTSSVFDEWKDNLKIFGDTAADAAERLERMNAAAEKSAQERVVELKKQGSLVSDIINGWNNRLGALSAAAEEAFRNTAQGGNYAAKAVAEVTDATNLLRIAQQNVAAGGFITWANRLAQQALEIELAFKGQAEATDRLAESLENVAERGGVSADAIATLTRQAESAKTSFTLLDQARLDRLQDAIEGANDKLREMQEETQSARDRLTELNAELLEARGLDQKAQLLRQQLDYQQTLAEIEAQQREAELTGNRELITILNEQRSTLEQINRVKIANIQADTDNSAATDRTTASISRLADEAERAGRAMNQVSAADLSKLSIQSETLRRNFADLNTLL